MMFDAVCTKKKGGCCLIGVAQAETGENFALILFCGVPCLVRF
ncbi:MAG TPA: hypothetical protein PLB10_18720 [Thiolinea sp.]|nr:hypothetical protein [Thiolinea sp.]